MMHPTPQVTTYELAARISKTKGLDGQLIAQELGELSVLRVGLEVWIVPPTLEGVRHTSITGVQESARSDAVVLYLEGVTTRTQASELAGRYLMVRGEELKEAPVRMRGDVLSHESGRSPQGSDADSQQSFSASPATSQVLAAVVLDTHFIDTGYGPLGKLVSIKQGPAYDIWVVEGQRGRLEIPAVDEYLATTDQPHEQPSVASEECGEAQVSSGPVLLTLPRGFLEITGQGAQECASGKHGAKKRASKKEH